MRVIAGQRHSERVNVSCFLCGKDLCHHGRRRYSVSGVQCLDCGITGRFPIGDYVLPTFEGLVDWRSGVFAPVCASCYEKERDGIQGSHGFTEEVSKPKDV